MLGQENGLGDRIKRALSLIGITEERVSSFIGRPCGCSKRVEKLNRLGLWATRIINGRTEDAEEYLQEIIDDD